jgi:hypothetical protein
MNPKLVGLIVGLWLGFIWVIWDFGDMVLVALIGLVGYLVGRVVTGELDVQGHLQRLSDRR